MTAAHLIRKARQIYLSGQFFKFLVVGGVALVVHWLARIVLDLWLTYSASIIVAYGVGLATAFTLHRKLVFPASKRKRHQEIAVFLVVNLISFPFVWAVSLLLSERILANLLPTEIARMVGHGIAITLPVFLHFVLHKFFTFRSD